MDGTEHTHDLCERMPGGNTPGVPGDGERDEITDEQELARRWEAIALPGAALETEDGKPVVVVSSGRRNKGAGPDYRNAVVLIEGRLTTGDIELHVREGDWFAHGHHKDPAYGGVILHVLARTKGTLRLDIPTVLVRRSVAVSGKDPGVVWSERFNAAVRVCSGAEGDAPQLFAELSWQRLYRRVAEFLGEEPGAPIGDRVRRGFIRGVFDCLGYSANRAPMRDVARVLLEDEEELRVFSSAEIVGNVFAVSGIPPERFRTGLDRWADVSEGGSSEPAAMLYRRQGGADERNRSATRPWKYAVRPANSPQRRLLAGGLLLAELYHRKLLECLEYAVHSECSWGEIIGMLMVSVPGQSGTVSGLGEPRKSGFAGMNNLIGKERARDIAVNALLPVMIGGALLRNDSAGIIRLCERYRSAPGGAPNKILGRVRELLPHDAELRGAFWQQGGMEYARRWLPEIQSAASCASESSASDAPNLSGCDEQRNRNRSDRGDEEMRGGRISEPAESYAVHRRYRGDGAMRRPSVVYTT